MCLQRSTKVPHRLKIGSTKPAQLSSGISNARNTNIEENVASPSPTDERKAMKLPNEESGGGKTGNIKPESDKTVSSTLLLVEQEAEIKLSNEDASIKKDDQKLPNSDKSNLITKLSKLLQAEEYIPLGIEEMRLTKQYQSDLQNKFIEIHKAVPELESLYEVVQSKGINMDNMEEDKIMPLLKDLKFKDEGKGVMFDYNAEVQAAIKQRIDLSDQLLEYLLLKLEDSFMRIDSFNDDSLRKNLDFIEFMMDAMKIKTVPFGSLDFVDYMVMRLERLITKGLQESPDDQDLLGIQCLLNAEKVPDEGEELIEVDGDEFAEECRRLCDKHSLLYAYFLLKGCAKDKEERFAKDKEEGED